MMTAFVLALVLVAIAWHNHTYIRPLSQQ